MIDEWEDSVLPDDDDEVFWDEETALQKWWEKELDEDFDINPHLCAGDTGFYTSELKLQTVENVIECCEQLIEFLEEENKCKTS